MSEPSKRTGPTAAGTARTAIAAFAGRLRDRIGRPVPPDDHHDARQLPEDQAETQPEPTEGEPDQQSAPEDRPGTKPPWEATSAGAPSPMPE